MNIKAKYLVLTLLISVSWLFTRAAYPDPSIDITDGKADENRGKITQIEEETNAALVELQSQIDDLTALLGTQTTPIMYKGNCQTDPIGPPLNDVKFCLAVCRT